VLRHLPSTGMPSPLPRWNCWVRASFAFPSSSGLPRISAGSASTSPFSRPAQRSLLVTAYLFAKSLAGLSSLEASIASLPPRLFQLLPAGTTFAGWDSHPLSDGAFARRTEIPRYPGAQRQTSQCGGAEPVVANPPTAHGWTRSGAGAGWRSSGRSCCTDCTDELDGKTQAGIRDRSVDLPGLRRSVARDRRCHPSGHHRENSNGRRTACCPATGAAGIQHDQQYGNGSLTLRNGRGRQTRLADQRLPNQPPRVCACGHDTHRRSRHSTSQTNSTPFPFRWVVA